MKRRLLFIGLLGTSLLYACGGSSIPEGCGDGAVAGAEECEGADLAGHTCTSLGFDGGTLACSTRCTLDTSACTGTGPLCGNNIREGLEACDGTDLTGQTCDDQGFLGGTLACSASCTFDTTACTSPLCGNDVKETGEACDGSDLGGESCASQGLSGGTLLCSATCSLDTTSCTTAPVCGNNAREGAEVCDGTDLDGVDCLSLGGTGTLACLSDCTGYDFSSCVACGDETVNQGYEQCDGADLQGNNCTDFGYDGGTLGCLSTCYDFDLSQCMGLNSCGKASGSNIEQCDGIDLKGETCQSLGFSSGVLACHANCSFNVTNCVR